MSTGKLPYALVSKGKLAKPSGGRRAMSEALIQSFVRWASKGGLISWSPENHRARSGLVEHPQDKDLRIDLQSTFPDPRKPGRRWANFQLQDGDRTGKVSNSYAHLEMECGLQYPEEDVRQAWLASLTTTLTATLIWSPSEFQLRVLDAVRSDEPRHVTEIVNAMRAASYFHESQLDPLVSRVNEVLKLFLDLGFVQTAGKGNRTDLGERYLRTQQATEWLRQYA